MRVSLPEEVVALAVAVIESKKCCNERNWSLASWRGVATANGSAKVVSGLYNWSNNAAKRGPDRVV